MGLIALADALPLIQPHEEEMVGIIRGAWSSLKAYPKDKLIVLNSTARANIMSCEMRYRATAYFEGAGVHVRDHNRARFFLVADMLAIRFKKLDDELHSSNIPTQQVATIRGQLPLADIGNVSFIDVGYVLNVEQDDIARICAVCMNGANNFWEYDLITRADVSKVLDLFPATEIKELETEVRGKPHVMERRRGGGDDEAES